MNLFSLTIFKRATSVISLLASGVLCAEETEASALMASEQFAPLFTKMLVMLCLLLAILYVAAWAMKRVMDSRWQGAKSSDSIQILEKRMLHAKAGLYLIQVDNQKMLAVESPSGFQPLGQWKVESKETSQETDIS